MAKRKKYGSFRDRAKRAYLELQRKARMSEKRNKQNLKDKVFDLFNKKTTPPKWNKKEQKVATVKQQAKMEVKPPSTLGSLPKASDIYSSNGAPAHDGVNYIPRFYKGIEHYPDELYILVLAQIETKTPGWLNTRMGEYKGRIREINAILSSDRGVITGAGEFDTWDFFKLTPDLKFDPNKKFRFGMTGEEVNEIIKEYII